MDAYPVAQESQHQLPLERPLRVEQCDDGLFRKDRGGLWCGVGMGV